jgi:hypothetical protein
MSRDGTMYLALPTTEAIHSFGSAARGAERTWVQEVLLILRVFLGALLVNLRREVPATEEFLRGYWND